jgi:hypothetical protein
VKSLTETQVDELITALAVGDVDYCELVALGRYICWHRNDTLRRLVQCASTTQANNVLKAIGHLPGCPSC